MKIAAAHSPVLSHSRQTLFVPDQSAPLAPDHARGLVRAIGIVAAKNVSATTVAGVSWKLTTVPTTVTPQDLTAMLTNNNVTPEKAPLFAQEIRGLLGNPLVRSVLIAVSGGAIAYLVVEKTSWSRSTKWLTIGGVGLACAIAYLLLRHYRILV